MANFYNMYWDLAVLLNDTEDDNLVRCKDWVNWTLRDLVKMYQFEELVEVVSTTADSFDFRPVGRLKASTTLNVFSDSSADTMTATMYGYILNSGTRTYQTEDYLLSGTTTASGTSNFDFIDRLELTSDAVGDITISDGTDSKGTLLAGEDSVANDFLRVIKVDSGSTGDVEPISDRDRLLEFPGDSSYTKYMYTMRGSNIIFYNTTSGSTKTIYYYKRHPLLINDYDESPLFINEQDIVEAARLGWGTRFEDEQDGVMGKQLYKQKLGEIISDRVQPSDHLRTVKLNRRR